MWTYVRLAEEIGRHRRDRKTLNTARTGEGGGKEDSQTEGEVMLERGKREVGGGGG